MVISDALPIQFWPVSKYTFNETEPQGAFWKCFCQPWQASDTIAIQVDFGIINTLSLNLYNSDDGLIQSIGNGKYSRRRFIQPPSRRRRRTVFLMSKVRLKIFVGGNEVFKSDCLHVKEGMGRDCTNNIL